MRRKEDATDTLLTIEQHHRAADLRTCEEIMAILERNFRCKQKFEWYRKHSNTAACNLMDSDWELERRHELDDAYEYELFESIKKERGL